MSVSLIFVINASNNIFPTSGSIVWIIVVDGRWFPSNILSFVLFIVFLIVVVLDRVIFIPIIIIIHRLTSSCSIRTWYFFFKCLKHGGYVWFLFLNFIKICVAICILTVNLSETSQAHNFTFLKQIAALTPIIALIIHIWAILIIFISNFFLIGLFNEICFPFDELGLLFFQFSNFFSPIFLY